MKGLDALNKMLEVVLAYRPPRKKKKNTKRSKQINVKRTEVRVYGRRSDESSFRT